MIELHLPCGRFEALCRLTKRFDEIGGDYLKQTFIVYHPLSGDPMGTEGGGFRPTVGLMPAAAARVAIS